MKTYRLLLMAFVFSTGFLLSSGTVNSQQINVNFSVFQNDLGRYGRWINSPRYGQVWHYNEPGFRPYYTNGRWEYTQYGWAWVSGYDWGWAPFHYGRWELDPGFGWIWIPGYEWAPAWVSWSEYGGNYGWAPLGFGANINISFGAIPYNRWVFVPRQHINNYNVHNYYIHPSRNRSFRNAVVINNIYVNNKTQFLAGPRRQEVQRYTRNNIEVRNIEYGRPQRPASNTNASIRSENNVTQRPSGMDRVQRPQVGSGQLPESGRIQSPNSIAENRARLESRNSGFERPELAERPAPVQRLGRLETPQRVQTPTPAQREFPENRSSSEFQRSPERIQNPPARQSAPPQRTPAFREPQRSIGSPSTPGRPSIQQRPSGNVSERPGSLQRNSNGRLERRL